MTTTTTGSSLIDRAALPTDTFEWGAMKWLVTPEFNAGAGFTIGEVVLLPGKGHSAHNHPDSEEILYFLSGEGHQEVGDESFDVRAGDVIYIPKGVFHSTSNNGWEPIRVIAIYTPGGAEAVFQTLEDYRRVPAGTTPVFVRGDAGSDATS